jgi:hypothetical protein
MRRNLFMLVFLSLLLCSFVLSQTSNTGTDKAAQFRIRKQAVVSDLENRVKEMSAMPRVLMRFRIAAWLWKDGADDIGRAEELAVSAVDDLFRNRAELPVTFFATTTAELFSILDINSPQDSKGLRAKYQVGQAQGRDLRNSFLNGSGSDKADVDSAIRSLVSDSYQDVGLSFLLHRLRENRSAEFNRMLEAIVAVQEDRRRTLTPDTMLFISEFYAPKNLPPGLSGRFFRIVVDRAREASHMPAGMFENYFGLLKQNMPRIKERHPELSQEATQIHAVLSSRESQSSQAENERNERISGSPDKVAATIAEAEKLDSPSLRSNLYNRAATLALSQGKYKRSVDLMQAVSEIEITPPVSAEFTLVNMYNYFLADVIEKALISQDAESALYAINKMFEADRRRQSNSNK